MLKSRSRYLPRLCGLAAGALVAALLFAVPAIAGPTVTVRVEGESATLLPATKVTLSAPEPVSGCPADSVAAAINLAVGGNWDHGEANGGAGDFTETILGETHEFTKESDTWAEWVNYKWGGGICSDLLSEGDEVLMVADHEPEPFYAPTVLPLVVSELPSSAVVGRPFTVKVSAVHTPSEAFAEAGEGTPLPIEGANISGAGVSATSGPGGLATLTLTNAGQISLRATRSGDAPSAVFTICAHNEGDGNCGTTAATSPSAGSSTSSSTSTSTPAPYKGPYALVAGVKGILDGHVYAHGKAPRVLSGSILSHSAVTSVSLELRREYRGRCSAYDGTTDRFRATRCGTGSFFQAASGGVFSYLLPSALAPGRYVLDVKAIDAAGNQTALARGSSRIVFYVR